MLLTTEQALQFSLLVVCVCVFPYVEDHIFAHVHAKARIQPHLSFFRCCLPFDMDTGSLTGKAFAQAPWPANPSDSFACLTALELQARVSVSCFFI